MKNLLVYTNDTTPVTIKTMSSSHAAYEAMRRAWKAGYKAIYTDEAGLEAAKAKLGNQAVSTPAPVCKTEVDLPPWNENDNTPVVTPAPVEELPVHIVVYTHMRNNSKTIQYKNRNLAMRRYKEAKALVGKDVVNVIAGYRTIAVDFGDGRPYTYLCDRQYKPGQHVMAPTVNGDKPAVVTNWRIASIKDLRAIATAAGHTGKLSDFFKVI